MIFMILASIPTGIMYTIALNTVFTESMLLKGSFWYNYSIASRVISELTYILSSLVYAYTIYSKRHRLRFFTFDSLTVLFIFVMIYIDVIAFISKFNRPNFAPLGLDHAIVKFLIAASCITLWILFSRYILKNVNSRLWFALAFTALMILDQSIGPRIRGISMHYIESWMTDIYIKMMILH